MNEIQLIKMKKDVAQSINPIESSIITKHYCFSFISFLVVNFKEDIIELLEDSETYEIMKPELQILRMNRILAHCPFPDECDNYDFCEKNVCKADTCSEGRVFEKKNM